MLRVRRCLLAALVVVALAACAPQSPPTTAAARVVHHVSDQVAWMGLFYQTEPMVIASRIQNLTVPQASTSSVLWNVHQWDLK